MTEHVDYHVEARRCLRIAENKAATVADYAAIAHGYAMLATGPVADITEQIVLANQLNDLRVAAKAALDELPSEFDTGAVRRFGDLIGL